MMKTLLLLYFLFGSFFCFSQKILQQKHRKQDSIKIVYYDRINSSNKNPPAVFINQRFVGDIDWLLLLDPQKINDLQIEKEPFVKNGTPYFGKILIRVKPSYFNNLSTINRLSQELLPLNDLPVLYQVNDKIIDGDIKDMLVDSNLIYSITVQQVETSPKKLKINVVKITTTTSEEQKTDNIIIRGRDLQRPELHKE